MSLVQRIRDCRICEKGLPLGPRPIVQLHPDAKILIAGQAPGSRVHETGVPFDDPSGDRLRDWMGIDKDTFYDEKRIALLPMGFCFPGTGKSGDLPPLKICATTWRQEALNFLENVQLTLVIGQYAQAWHIEDTKKNLTETVRAWQDYGDAMMPLPHPSPRNNIWLAKNQWFEKDLVPVLQERVAKLIS
jgi:uracil-DNA glycosylase